MKINVIYEDNHLLVVEKPIGVLSQEDKTKEPDLLNILKQYIKEKYNKPGNVYLGLLHRLDRPVGGIMVFARTSKAAARISEQIRNKEFNKTYLAVVNGIISDKTGSWKDFLYKDKKNNMSKVVSTSKIGAKEAILDYHTLESNMNFSLVKIKLRTGRHHQIRVQFSSRGYPLIGDSKYNKLSNESCDIALWAYEISFIHPIEKRKIFFRCEPPDMYPYNKFKNINKYNS